MIPKKAELAIHLLTMELRNAKARQKLRIRQERTLSKRIETDIYFIEVSLKNLKSELKHLFNNEKLEAKIRKEGKKINRDVGTNFKQTGTYGKV